MSIIAALHRALSPDIQSTPSDFLDAWIRDRSPSTAELSAELARVDAFAKECDKSFRDAIADREAKLRDKILDGDNPTWDIHDPLSPELQKVVGGWRTVAENNFGVRADFDTGTCRTAPEECRRRRQILIRHLQARFRSGDIPSEITQAIKRIQDVKLSLIDLRAAERPLRPRAAIAPEQFQPALDEAVSNTRMAEAEINEIISDLHRRGYDRARP